MNQYMKAFVYAGLFYLGLATVFGILNGTIGLGYWGVFAHAHFSLLGFMSMMIYGIGYFILPRFSGSELRFPGWVPVHFWLGNLSLPGMVVSRAYEVEDGSGLAGLLFVIFASLQAVSIFMFIVNVWMSLSPATGSAAEPAVAGQSAAPSQTLPPKPSIEVTADTSIADLVDASPSIKEILVRAGFSPLAQPEHFERVRRMGITLGMGCGNHGIDVEGMISVLKEELRKTGAVSKSAAPSAGVGSGTEAAVVTSETLIGTVIKEYPASRPVFEKYFGSGCFDCPGQAYESVDMACRMHGVDPKGVLEEINQALRS